MSRFLNEKYRGFEAYVPGEQPQDQPFIKLNTNESPYPPPQNVVDAVLGDEVRKLRLYSDPECKKLRESLARFYSVRPEMVYVSNGSDDILNFSFMAFGGDGVIFPEISYGFYRVFAELYGLDAVKPPLLEDFSINVNDYCNTNRLTVIANPNAPTGMALSKAEVERIVRTNPDHVVLIDEAYVDFGAESCVELTQKYDNLLVVMTYSKSRCLAGARLGFAIGSDQLIADLEKIKYSTNPYNVNRLTLVAGEAALSCAEYYGQKCREIMDTREWTVGELQKLGFFVLPSRANFIFARSPQIGGGALYQALKDRGILIRHFDDPKISDFNRITIGRKEEMEALITNIKLILGRDVK